jgi:hypothetical protein
MPELMGAYERDGHQFAAVRIQLSTEAETVEFFVDPAGYESVRRIIQSRPFEAMPSVVYRYFFAGRYSRQKLGVDPVSFGVRVETERDAKTIDFDGPTSLLSNLLWFATIKTAAEVAHLRSTQKHIEEDK